MKYLAFRVATTLLPHVPEVLGYRIFGWLGDLLGVFSPQMSARVSGNLARALEEPIAGGRLVTLTRACLRNLCWNYYELFHGPAWDVETLASRVAVDGAEHLEAAHRERRGVILLFAHVGALEALTQLPPLYPQYHFVTLVEHMTDPRMHELMRRVRARHGLEIVPVDASLRAVRLLRHNSVLAVGADRDMTASGVLVPFFGSSARLPVGAVQLALRYQVPVLFTYACRESPREAPSVFRVRIHAPFRFERTGDLGEDTRAGVALVARALESAVRARPEQWLANYRFWPIA